MSLTKQDCIFAVGIFLIVDMPIIAGMILVVYSYLYVEDK